MSLLTKSNRVYPLVPIREGIVFPNTENVLIFGRQKSTLAINEALKGEKKVILVMQKTASQDNPDKNELFEIGVLVLIKNIVQGDKGEINALVHGLEKVRITKFIKENPFFEATVETVQDTILEDDETHGIIKYIGSQVKKAINLGKTIDFIFLMNILNVRSPIDFSNQVAMVLDLREHERQELLEDNNLK